MEGANYKNKARPALFTAGEKEKTTDTNTSSKQGGEKGRLYKIKRIFKDRTEDIIKAYSGYDRTFFNPVNEEFVARCMIDGEFWEVTLDDEMAACVFFMPACCSRFKGLNASWECADLLGDSLGDYAVCGYIAPRTGAGEKEIYRRLFKLAKVYRRKIGAGKLLFYTPVKLYCPWQRLFDEGLLLSGLRGLDNAVANFIFSGSVLINYGPKQEYNDELTCRLTDTKRLSMLLEKGYKGHRITQQNEIVLGR